MVVSVVVLWVCHWTGIASEAVTVNGVLTEKFWKLPAIENVPRFRMESICVHRPTRRFQNNVSGFTGGGRTLVIVVVDGMVVVPADALPIVALLRAISSTSGALHWVKL